MATWFIDADDSAKNRMFCSSANAFMLGVSGRARRAKDSRASVHASNIGPADLRTQTTRATAASQITVKTYASPRTRG